MGRIYYGAHGKLVRDRMPERFREWGNAFACEVMTPEEYRRALLDKVREEVDEVCAAADTTPDALAEELADLDEVLAALKAAYGLVQLAHQKRIEKFVKRGVFAQRLKLLWHDDQGVHGCLVGTGGEWRPA